MSQELVTQFGETIVVIIGFVIFVAVLKKFAWGPILDLLDERRAKIAEGFQEVENLQAQAKTSHAEYEEKLREIDAEAREKINEAIAEGKRVGEEMTEAARVEAAEIVQKAKASVQMELATARKQLREDVVDLTLLAAGRLLEEKLTDEKDRQLVAAFVSDLEQA